MLMSAFAFRWLFSDMCALLHDQRSLNSPGKLMPGCSGNSFSLYNRA